jgi:hypothetical protein
LRVKKLIQEIRSSGTPYAMVDPVVVLGLMGIAAAHVWIEADKDKQKYRKYKGVQRILSTICVR